MRVIRKVLLAPRGQVRHEMLPQGCMVVRIGMQDGSPYAWVWLNPNELILQNMDFLIVAVGDEVGDDLFYPLNTFTDRADDGLWFGLVKYGAIYNPDPFYKS